VGTDIAYKLGTKFLSIHINENVKWDGHINYLRSKLSESHYVINSLKDVTSSRYEKYTFHIFSWSLKGWGNFWGCDPQSKNIFKLKKRVIQLISNAGRYTSCKELFKALNILPVPCLYILVNEIVCQIKINTESWNKT
jgi:hypothetical protein